MSEDMKEACNLKVKQIKDIFIEHRKGRFTRQIAARIRVADSYIVDTIKKGEGQAITDIKKLYGINDDNVNSSGMIPSTHEYLCECGNVMEDGKTEKAEDGYIFRTLDCPKCKKHYINPIDAKRYLYD